MGEVAEKMNNSSEIYNPAFVKSVFDKCSSRYIAFSYWASMGFTERWRRQCVAAIPATQNVKPVVYDLMSGTGEVWPHLLQRYHDVEQIVAVDISGGMHKYAIERLHKYRAHRIDFIEDDVLVSQLAPESADIIVSTFGLKTFNDDQHKQLASVIARTLKPDGTFSMIEASDPKDWWLRPLYRFHLAVILPMIERLFLRGAQDFSMIAVYSKNFGDARCMTAALKAKGLEVEYRRYFFGCATGVVGRKVAIRDE